MRNCKEYGYHQQMIHRTDTSLLGILMYLHTFVQRYSITEPVTFPSTHITALTFRKIKIRTTGFADDLLYPYKELILLALFYRLTHKQVYIFFEYHLIIFPIFF